MKKISVVIFLLFFALNMAFSQTGKVKKTIMGNKVELLVPAHFSTTDDISTALFNKAYSFSDHTEKIKLIYSWSDDGTVTDNDIPGYTDILIKEMKQMVSSFKLLDDGIHLQDGKNIGYIKYMVKEEGTEIFCYQFYVSVEDKVLFFIFSCPKKIRLKWEADAAIIANSVRVKP